jgi:hypothetical protein
MANEYAVDDVVDGLDRSRDDGGNRILQEKLADGSRGKFVRRIYVHRWCEILHAHRFIGTCKDERPYGE